MFQSYKIVRSIPNRSGRIYEDFSGASRLYRSGQRQTVRGPESFGLYLEAGNVRHIARAVFGCVKIAFTPGVRNKTRAPVLARVTSGIKDIINAIFEDYKILLPLGASTLGAVRRSSCRDPLNLRGSQQPQNRTQ